MMPLMRALWIPRLLLFIVFLPHGIGKITGFAAFQDKFALPATVTVLLILAELGGAFAVVSGGFLPGRWGVAATWAGAGCLLVSQVGAITYARWPRWLEFSPGGGSEYNFVLCGLCVLLIYGHWLAASRQFGPLRK